MLCLIRYDEENFSKPLITFMDTQPVYIIDFDAALTGAGILWFERLNDTEACMGGSAVDHTPLGFGEDSSFQNLCEFIGVILGILVLVKLGINDVDIEVRGHSISA